MCRHLGVDVLQSAAYELTTAETNTRGNPVFDRARFLLFPSLWWLGGALAVLQHIKLIVQGHINVTLVTEP